jgi:ATP-dependent protease HslVU (ClpYQ) ATPase subunit
MQLNGILKKEITPKNNISVGVTGNLLDNHLKN